MGKRAGVRPAMAANLLSFDSGTAYGFICPRGPDRLEVKA